MDSMHLLVLLTLLALGCLTETSGSVQTSEVSSQYRAAVLQSVPFVLEGKHRSHGEKLHAMGWNGLQFAKYAKEARSAGADILVTAEDGLMPDACFEGRDTTEACMLTKPASVGTIPCDNFSSAWAKDDKPQPSSPEETCVYGKDANCHHDGHYQLNTQLVLDHTGTVVQRYRKSHLWLTESYTWTRFASEGTDPAPEGPVQSTYTNFGVELGMFICYDVFFSDLGPAMAERGIRHFTMSTYWQWVPLPPMFPAVQVQQGWSSMTGAALLASNVGTGNLGGSGIFSGGRALAYRSSLDIKQDWQLLVADVERNPSFSRNRHVPWDDKHGEYPSNRIRCGNEGTQKEQRAMYVSPDKDRQEVWVETGKVRCEVEFEAWNEAVGNATYSLTALDGPFFPEIPATSAGRGACVFMMCPNGDCTTAWVTPDDDPDLDDVTYFKTSVVFSSFRLRIVALTACEELTANHVMPILGLADGDLSDDWVVEQSRWDKMSMNRIVSQWHGTAPVTNAALIALD